MHQSLAGSSIYTSGRALQRSTTTVNTPMVCMTLFQLDICAPNIDEYSQRFVLASLEDLVFFLILLWYPVLYIDCPC